MATLPAEFATLLAPIGGSLEEVSAQARLTQALPSPGVSVYRFTDHREDHYFLFAQEDLWKFDEWKSDAEFLYSCSTNGKLNLLIFCNGTYVEFCGKRIASSPRRVSRCEIASCDGRMQVVCSEEEILVSEEGVSKAFESGQTVSRESGEADH
jgi:hypothetical protein